MSTTSLYNPVMKYVAGRSHYFAPYTPVNFLPAGSVILLGDAVWINHSDINAGVLGAASVGGCVYDAPTTIGSDTGSVIAIGQLVYWDSVNHVVLNVAGPYFLGVAVAASPNTATTVTFLHMPAVPVS